MMCLCDYRIGPNLLIRHNEEQNLQREKKRKFSTEKGWRIEEKMSKDTGDAI